MSNPISRKLAAAKHRWQEFEPGQKRFMVVYSVIMVTVIDIVFNISMTLLVWLTENITHSSLHSPFNVSGWESLGSGIFWTTILFGYLEISVRRNRK